VASRIDAIADALKLEDFKAAAAAKKELAVAITDRAKGKGGKLKVNRLLVQMRDGSLHTCNPDGSSTVSLSVEEDAGSHQYFQPTWSPTGDLVSCTRIDKSRKDGTSSRVMIKWAFDGSSHVEADAAFIPFYFMWTPSGGRLTYLTTYASPDGPKVAPPLNPRTRSHKP
jgi:hypothetical protein